MPGRTALVATVLLLIACGPGGATLAPTTSPTTAPTPRPPDEPAQTPPSVPASGERPLPVNTLPPLPTPGPEGVPTGILDAILAQVESLSGVARDELQIERAEAVTWPDGALGCPEPGMMYTQALVDGFWVVVRAGDESFDFRATANSFRLCEPRLVPAPTGG